MMKQPVEQIGRYRVVEELGRGAMGIVYKAEDPAIGRTIAIKRIRLGELTDESERERMRERLFREARSAGMLSHPGIVTIYDTLEEDGVANIFMEWVNGPTLEKTLTDSTLDGPELLGLLRQTAEALDYAHEQGIVHRDIKPGNIMVNEQGRAKIADFGVARIMSQQLTQSGALLGTPNYMAPEQVQGLPADGRADQFALAVIAYEALTGEKPFSADHIATLLYKITREEPLPPSRFNASLGQGVDVVLRKGLAKKPQDRYTSCADFIDALTATCAASPSWAPLPRGASTTLPTVMEENAPQPLPDWKRPAPPRTYHWFRWGFGGAGLAAFAFGAWWLWPRPQPVEPPKEPEPVAVETPTPLVEVTPETSPADAAKTPPSPLPPSVVEFTSQPAASRVAADRDDVLVCNTPCKLTLAAGKHNIVFSRIGYRDAVKLVDVPADAPVTVDLVLITGTLTLSTTPAGLSVWIDGQEIARKTPFSTTLTTGEHRVRVVNGGETQEFSVQIFDGGITSKTIEWQAAN